MLLLDVFPGIIFGKHVTAERFRSPKAFRLYVEML